jgi:hypothetical protein
MAQPFLTPIDMNQLEILNLRIQQLASDPGSPVDGQIWYNTTSKVYKGRQNATVVILATMADLASFMTASSTNTLTNKTFDANGTGNSITNIEIADFAAGVIETTLTGGSSNLVRADAIKTAIDNAAQATDWKDAVRVSTTVAGTLASSFVNGQTIDGQVLATGDRILIKDQSTGSENGIYTVNASGVPTRAIQADTANEVWSAACYTMQGTVNGGTSWVNTNTTLPTLGSTALTFAQISGATTPDASTSTKGKIQIATLAETEAKTDNLKAVVSANLTNFPIKKSFSCGDGAALFYVLTHNLGTTDVIVQVSRVVSPFDVVNCDIERTSTNSVTVRFAVAPTTNQFRVNITG